MAGARRASVRRAFGAALLCLALGAPARAGASDAVWIEQLTSTEFRDRVAAGATTVIIPVGGVEQSGPYVALGKHDARVQALAERIARALGHTLVAPVVAYVPEGAIDPPTEHMRFAGTITVPAEAFRSILESAARSLVRHGILDVVLIGDHGGYQGDLRMVADRLDKSWAGTPARATYVPDYYRAATTGFSGILRDKGLTPAEIGTHAGVADTSLTMAVDPTLVRGDRVAASPPPGAAAGVYGDPRRSSAALGQLGLDAIVDRSVAAIRVALRPRHPDIHN